MNMNSLSLNLRTTQTLSLSPQLVHSLQLLQTPALELNALIEQELELNPVLESVVEEENNDGEAPAESGSDAASADEKPAVDSAQSDARELEDFGREFARLVELDDLGSDSRVQSRFSTEDEEKRQFVFDSLTSTTSYAELIMEQVRESDLPAELHPVAELLIGNINETGFLVESVENLAISTGLPEADLGMALKAIQGCDPVGVGARDLRECLMLQLEHGGKEGSFEYRVVRDFMEELGKRRWASIARQTGTYIDEVQDALENLAKLNPRPGRGGLPEEEHYVAPEVFVEREGQDFTVSLGNDHVPFLRISRTYRELMSAPHCSPDAVRYIRDKIRDGTLLIKSLHHRRQTILRVAQEIVKRQRDFMESGPAYLKPLKMQEIADIVGMHETTVSRTVAGKYMQTPHGVFEMRHFFAAGIATSAGLVSNRSVQDRVVQLIAGEDSAMPLSDQKVAELLKADGIPIARRTVAKYRTDKRILRSEYRRNGGSLACNRGDSWR